MRPVTPAPASPANAMPDNDDQPTPPMIEGLPSGVTARRGQDPGPQDVAMLQERIRDLERQIRDQSAAAEPAQTLMPSSMQPDQFTSATSRPSSTPSRASTTPLMHRAEEVISEQVTYNKREPFYTTRDGIPLLRLPLTPHLTPRLSAEVMPDRDDRGIDEHAHELWIHIHQLSPDEAISHLNAIICHNLVHMHYILPQWVMNNVSQLHDGTMGDMFVLATTPSQVETRMRLLMEKNRQRVGQAMWNPMQSPPMAARVPSPVMNFSQRNMMMPEQMYLQSSPRNFPPPSMSQNDRDDLSVRSSGSAGSRGSGATGSSGHSAASTRDGEIEDAISHLRMGNIEQALAIMQNGPLGNTASPQVMPQVMPAQAPLGTPQTQDASEALATCIMAQTSMLQMMHQERRNPVAQLESVKFSTFKDAGTADGQVRIEDILYNWEGEFASADIAPSVSKIWKSMNTQGNLYRFCNNFRSSTADGRGDYNNPEDIRNWDWDRFRQTLLTSHLYQPLDPQKLHADFKNVRCQEPGTDEQIVEYSIAFQNSVHMLRRYGLYADYTEAFRAQKFYDGLPEMLKVYMEIRCPSEHTPGIRRDYDATVEEVRKTRLFLPYKKALAAGIKDMKQARPSTVALPAVGTPQAPPPNGGRPRREQIPKLPGEVVNFSRASPSSRTWLEANAKGSNIKHQTIRQGQIHVLVGTEADLTRFFALPACKSAGIQKLDALEKYTKRPVAAAATSAAADDASAPAPTSSNHIPIPLPSPEGGEVVGRGGGNSGEGGGMQAYQYYAGPPPTSMAAFGGHVRGMMAYTTNIPTLKEEIEEQDNPVSEIVNQNTTEIEEEIMEHPVSEIVNQHTTEIEEEIMEHEPMMHSNEVNPDDGISSISRGAPGIISRIRKGGVALIAILRYVATYDTVNAFAHAPPVIPPPYASRRMLRASAITILAVVISLLTAHTFINSADVTSSAAYMTATTLVVPLQLHQLISQFSGLVSQTTGCIAHVLYSFSMMACTSTYDTISDIVFIRPGFKYLHSHARPMHGTVVSKHVMLPAHASTFTAMTANIEKSKLDALLVCLKLNFEMDDQLVGMLDSGCNMILLNSTPHIRANVSHYDPQGRVTGEGVKNTFATEASGNIGITLPGMSPDKRPIQFDLNANIQLVQDLAHNLFPVSWLTRNGCDVFHHGRTHINDPSPAGYSEIRLHEFDRDQGRQFKGNLELKSWNDLWFFNFAVHRPVSVPAVVAAAANASAMSKISRTVKAHATFAFSGPRRIHNLFMSANRGDEILSDLPCPCPISAVTHSEMPSRRQHERAFQHPEVSSSEVQGEYWIPPDTEPELRRAVETMQAMDEAEAKHETKNAPNIRRGIPSARRHSTAPRQYWHADTIPLPAKNWNKAAHALILVDDYTRMTFAYLLKSKNQFDVAAALEQHFLHQRPASSGVKGINFFLHRTQLRSDRGSEFINATVQRLCDRLGCIQEYSSPGQLGKYQNGVVERKIKEIGKMCRSMMYSSGLPSHGTAYCVLQAVDICNALPTTANPADPDDPTTDVTGYSPYYTYYGSTPSIDNYHPFGSFVTVHLDDDHRDPDAPNIKAAPCVYLCNASHFHSKGHVVWQYQANSVKGRKLIVPELHRTIWNYFPMRSGDDRHLSDNLTFVSARVDGLSQSELPPCPTPEDSTIGEDKYDPSSDYFPDSSVILDSEELKIPVNPLVVTKYKERKYKRMLQNVGKKVRRVFFINGTDGATDYFEGYVRSITPTFHYDVAYDDNDSEEMTEIQFTRYSADVRHQKQAHLAQFGGTKWQPKPECNCANSHCYHPWAKDTPHFDPNHKTGICMKAGIRMEESKSRKTPSMVPPLIPEYHAAMTFPDLMPDAVDLENDIQGMLSWAVMAANKKKNIKMSAYPPDPLNIPECQSSENWSNPTQGNSWYEAIMSEIGNLRKFNVFEVIPLSSLPTGKRLFSIVISFVTKRTKDSTPEKEVIDKRKCRICFGGHHMQAGVHFQKHEAFAPVPSWTTIKLQMALTARHRMGLRAFDCVAAYLQADLKEPLYVRPPQGLNSEMNHGPQDIWKLNKALYGYAVSGRLWWDKVSTWLEAYGFRPLGNSGTFMMLDRRNDSDARMRGIILLNLYSDDGLASIDNSMLWDNFMKDFKRDFDVIEKDPDYFLGCAIHWDSETGIIELDASKYLREVVTKFDMVGAHPSPIPAPAGTKVYMNEEWSGDENFRNLYQQYCGCINYAALMRPELAFYASQICRVMSCPTTENLSLAQNILKYMIGSLDERLTFRPTDLKADVHDDVNTELMLFTDSDWATCLETRRSHGCYVLMFAGACISHRSKAHKSVMLSSAAAEYYEASEGCRELAYIRGILEDFYGFRLPPTPTYIDNQACIQMGIAPVFSERQKHIPIRICHLKECRREGMVELRPISTKFQLADIGTKALPAPVFQPLRDTILGKMSFRKLQGF
jgi:hypothetical protein